MNRGDTVMTAMEGLVLIRTRKEKGGLKMRHLFRKRIFAKGIAICLVAMLAGTVHAATADKPNIVIIWGDDIGHSPTSVLTPWA